MLIRLARAAFLVLALLSGGAVAKADELTDFNAAVEAAAAHNRVAIGYLRSGNVGLASLEIDRLRTAWSKLVEQFSRHRPAAFDGNVLYGKTLVGISARLVGADLMLKSGRLDSARQSLDAIRGDLYALRKSAHIVVLADCVRDSHAAIDRLMVYSNRDLDWTNPPTRIDVADRATTYGRVLDRCDVTAGAAQRKQPEFRRLIDGAKQALALIPKAIETRDTDLLQRVLIQLRTFDNLLTIRFG
jgi:hypothetical protein